MAVLDDSSPPSPYHRVYIVFAPLLPASLLPAVLSGTCICLKYKATGRIETAFHLVSNKSFDIFIHPFELVLIKFVELFHDVKLRLVAVPFQRVCMKSRRKSDLEFLPVPPHSHNHLITMIYKRPTVVLCFLDNLASHCLSMRQNYNYRTTPAMAFIVMG